MTKNAYRWIASLASAAALTAVVGCGGDSNNNNNNINNNNSDMAMAAASPDLAPPSCYTNPTTSDELINGCTTPDVVSIDIMPFYPDKAPNGVLPVLPPTM